MPAETVERDSSMLERIYSSSQRRLAGRARGRYADAGTELALLAVIVVIGLAIWIGNHSFITPANIFDTMQSVDIIGLIAFRGSL